MVRNCDLMARIGVMMDGCGDEVKHARELHRLHLHLTSRTAAPVSAPELPVPVRKALCP